VTNEFYMTDLADRRSYNFGDTFGDPVETESLPTPLPVDGTSKPPPCLSRMMQFCNRVARHKSPRNEKSPISEGNSHNAHES
jgi:hypothetical protein